LVVAWSEQAGRAPSATSANSPAEAIAKDWVIVVGASKAAFVNTRCRVSIIDFYRLDVPAMDDDEVIPARKDYWIPLLWL